MDSIAVFSVSTINKNNFTVLQSAQRVPALPGHSYFKSDTAVGLCPQNNPYHAVPRGLFIRTQIKLKHRISQGNLHFFCQ